MDEERQILTLYRALNNLDIGKGRRIDKGDVFMSDRIAKKNLEKLEELGKVVQVSTPPLGALPDWQTRAKDLAKKVGITTVEDLLNSDAEIVAERMNISVKKVQSWRTEILSLFVITRDGDGGCVARRNRNK